MQHGTLIATRASFSQVASGTSSVTILAANGERVGGIIANTDTNALYLRLDGGTVTSANYSVMLAQNAEFQIPLGFTGLITGIWAGDGSGNANVTELTYATGAL